MAKLKDPSTPPFDPFVAQPYNSTIQDPNAPWAQSVVPQNFVQGLLGSTITGAMSGGPAMPNKAKINTLTGPGDTSGFDQFFANLVPQGGNNIAPTDLTDYMSTFQDVPGAGGTTGQPNSTADPRGTWVWDPNDPSGLSGYWDNSAPSAGGSNYQVPPLAGPSGVPYNGNTGIAGPGGGAGVPHLDPTHPGFYTDGTPAGPQTVTQPPPGQTPPTAPRAHSTAPSGWDQGKWDDPTKHDPKYDWAHLVMDAGGTINNQNMPDLVRQIQALYPQATWDGGDHIDFHDGVGPVDVWLASGTGSGGPGWIPDSDNGPSATGRQDGMGLRRMGDGGNSGLESLLGQLGGGGDNRGGDGGGAPSFGGGGSGGGGDARGGTGGRKSLEQVISELLSTGGGFSEGNLATRFENNRGIIDRGRTAQLNQTNAQLADRGLLSMPGAAQGEEVNSIGRIEQNLAPIYADANRQALLDETQAADQRLFQAMGAGTSIQNTNTQASTQRYVAELANQLGMSQLEVTKMLGLGQLELGQGQLGLGYGQLGVQRELGLGQLGLGWGQLGETHSNNTNQYNLGLGQLALGNLNSNNAWNMFIAQHGLDSQRLAFEMQNGNMQNFITMLEMFNRAAQNSAGGHV